MATTPSSLKGLTATAGTEGVPAIGYLTWFSIPDEGVRLQSLRRNLGIHGLPTSLAPKDTKAVNAFKRAVSMLDGKHRENGHIRENVVKPVLENGREVVYQVSSTVRDLDERIIEFPKALRVIFNKSTEDVSYNRLGGVKPSEVLPLIEMIDEGYAANSKSVTGSKVRAIVRGYLKDQPDDERGIEGLSGENLRGKAGGIYFIPAKHKSELDALSEMLDELYKGKAYLHYIPMADSAATREIIRRHHVANTRQEMVEAISTVKGLLATPDRDRAVRSNVIAHHWANFRQLQRRTKEYATILHDEQDEIESMVDILNKQLDKLLG